MLRVSRLTDYATVLLTVLAREPAALQSATTLAEQARLEPPTTSKVLKQLGQAGLVESQRGAAGGYRLSRPASEISLADVVIAIEGPIGMTECSIQPGECGHEPHCGISSGWQRVSMAISSALRSVSLADLLRQTPLKIDARRIAAQVLGSAPAARPGR